MKSLSFLALILLGAITAFAQTPPAGTVISNQATVRYVDPSGNTHNETSNTVTFTVAKVGGLAITPDAQVAPGLVATQTQILSFTIANTGNYDESVLFPASARNFRRHVGHSLATIEAISRTAIWLSDRKSVV